MWTRPIAPILALVMVAALPAGAQDTAPGAGETRDSGVVEEVETRLMQVQVVVKGSAEKLSGLGRDDFELFVGGEAIEDFVVDRLWSAADESEAETVPAPRRPATYIFYFDQPMLTQRGRDISIGSTRELITKLITGTDLGMIVSNGKTLEIYAEPTGDGEVLLAALERLDHDAEHRNDWATQEEQYLASLQRSMDDADDSGRFGGVPNAVIGNPDNPNRGAVGGGFDAFENAGDSGSLPEQMDSGLVSDREHKQTAAQSKSKNLNEAVKAHARSHETEALWRAQTSLDRLRALLARVHDLDRPKSVLYFADILRFEPGSVFLELTDQRGARDVRALFEEVVNHAAAQGVRFYTVEGRGLVASTDAGAHNALTFLALETGGQAFLRSVDADGMATRIVNDLSSMFLLSFDPTGLKKDAALAVEVRTRTRGIKLRSGTRVVVQSEAARANARLLAAYVGTGGGDDSVAVGATVIPTGYSDGVFHALVQVSAAGVPVPRPTWEVGASLVSGGRVRDEASRQITVGGAGVPVTFEREMTFAPGPYELIAVVRQSDTNEVGSRRIDGLWPDPDDAPAAVGPIAVIQPSQRVLVRGEQTRTSGALAVGESEAVRLDLPLAVVSLVCRQKKHKETIRVHRSLTGGSRADFEPVEIDSEGERCAVLTDMVPARTLGEGHFRFAVEVMCGEESCATGERTFTAVEPAP